MLGTYSLESIQFLIHITCFYLVLFPYNATMNAVISSRVNGFKNNSNKINENLTSYITIQLLSGKKNMPD